jgi:histidine triad (HIT) family protein
VEPTADVIAVSRAASLGAVSSDCLFCAIAAGDTDGHLVLRTQDVVGFLDMRPVFKGHTLLVPRRHVATLPDLPAELRSPFLEAGQWLASAMVHALGAQGSFVAMNNVVSQSVAHLHLHVVPRTKGDGLRGFFWPRTKYDGPDEAADYARRLRTALPPQGTDGLG